MMYKNLPKIFFPILRSICYTFIFISLTPLFCFAQQWQHLGLSGEVVQRIAIDTTNPNIIYAGSTSNFSDGKVGKLFKTTNAGITWDTLLKTLNVTDIDIHPKDPNIVFVVSAVNALNPSRIYKTTNGGLTWKTSDSGMTRLPWSGPYILEINPSHPDTIFASTAGDDGGAVYKSTNGGLFWTKLLPLNYFEGGAASIAFNPQNSNEIFIGEGFHTRLYHTVDGGIMWNNKGTKQVTLYIIKFHGNGRIYLGTGAAGTVSIVGLFFSDDTFKTWNHFNPGFTTSPTHVRRMVLTGDTLYLRGTDDLYRIIGDTMLYKFDIEGNKCREVAVNGNNLYLGTENGVYRRDIATNVKKIEGIIPTQTELYQNFPNPFNPTTDINYELAEPSMVRLSIFNLIGQKIALLTNEEQVAGKYNIKWNAEKLPSGVYFVRLQAGNYNSTKRMVLLK